MLVAHRIPWHVTLHLFSSFSYSGTPWSSLSPPGLYVLPFSYCPSISGVIYSCLYFRPPVLLPTFHFISFLPLRLPELTEFPLSRDRTLQAFFHEAVIITFLGPNWQLTCVSRTGHQKKSNNNARVSYFLKVRETKPYQDRGGRLLEKRHYFVYLRELVCDLGDDVGVVG